MKLLILLFLIILFKMSSKSEWGWDRGEKDTQGKKFKRIRDDSWFIVMLSTYPAKLSFLCSACFISKRGFLNWLIMKLIA